MTARRKATLRENEAALAVLAVIEASMKDDTIAADVVLQPWADDLAPVLQFATALLTGLVRECCDEPRIFIGSMRRDIIAEMARSTR